MSLSWTKWYRLIFDPPIQNILYKLKWSLMCLLFKLNYWDYLTSILRPVLRSFVCFNFRQRCTNASKSFFFFFYAHKLCEERNIHLTSILFVTAFCRYVKKKCFVLYWLWKVFRLAVFVYMCFSPHRKKKKKSSFVSICLIYCLYVHMCTFSQSSKKI